MKKLFLMALATVGMVSCSNNDYSVTAVFDNADLEGTTAYLMDYDSGEKLDSAVVKNKCVRFEGVADSSRVARLGLTKGRIQFILEPGDIQINEVGKATGTALNDKLEKMSEDLSATQKDTTVSAEEKFENFLKVFFRIFKFSAMLL